MSYFIICTDAEDSFRIDARPDVPLLQLSKVVYVSPGTIDRSLTK